MKIHPTARPTQINERTRLERRRARRGRCLGGGRPLHLPPRPRGLAVGGGGRGAAARGARSTYVLGVCVLAWAGTNEVICQQFVQQTQKIAGALQIEVDIPAAIARAAKAEAREAQQEQGQEQQRQRQPQEEDEEFDEALLPSACQQAIDGACVGRRPPPPALSNTNTQS